MEIDIDIRINIDAYINNIHIDIAIEVCETVASYVIRRSAIGHKRHVVRRRS